MTTAWICATPGGEQTAHDTEREAESRGEWLVQSKTATNAVIYRVDVEESA